MKKLFAATGLLVAITIATTLIVQRSSSTPSPVIAAAAPLEPDISTALTPLEAGTRRPLQLPTTGYSGTRMERADGDAAPAPISGPPRVTLPRWASYATDSQVDAVAAELPRARDYTETLIRLWQISGPNWVGKTDDRGYTTWEPQSRFNREPERMVSLLQAQCLKARGVARQNLIFQVAITLPAETAFPWLRELAQTGDSEDYHDTMCALAFAGDQAAVGWFQGLPVAACNCRRLVDRAKDHDELARQGERGFLRSYRCIETLDQRPYFHEHCFAFQQGPICSFPWATPRAGDPDLFRSLLPAWINHFEGHPGSDDMAYRLCELADRNGDCLEAARWASRCTTLPDQDMLRPGTRQLLTLAELNADERTLLMLNDWPDNDLNRNLFNYIRIRRCAAKQGAWAALSQLEQLAAQDTDLPICRAYRLRWAAPAVKGLDSGLCPLPTDDALRTVHGTLQRTHCFNALCWRRNWRGDSERLNPPRECIAMDESALAAQFRAWETLAELRARADTQAGDERSDLEYKFAAVLYHQPICLFPAYAVYSDDCSGVPWEVSEDQDWRGGAYAMLRASELFAELADGNPGYPARDKALFSAAMVRMKLCDARSFHCDWDRKPGIALFNRCAIEHPDSSLADDSLNAVRYWKRHG